MQGEQIRVSGHDAGCVAVDGQLQNEVVLGISAGANGRSDLDQLRFAGERDEKPVPLLSRDVPVETRITPRSSAWAKARPGAEAWNSNALTTTLVSKTSLLNAHPGLSAGSPA